MSKAYVWYKLDGALLDNVIVKVGTDVANLKGVIKKK